MHVQWPRHVHVCTVCGVFAQVLVTGVSRPGLGPVWGAVMSVSTCKESCRSNNWHHVATGGWVSWSAGFNRTATPCGSQCNGFVGHAKPHMYYYWPSLWEQCAWQQCAWEQCACEQCACEQCTWERCVRGNSVRGNGVQGNVVRGWVSWLCYCYWKSPRIALSRHSSNLFSYIPVSLIASQRASGMECIYFIESIPSAKTMFGIGVTEKGVIQ